MTVMTRLTAVLTLALLAVSTMAYAQADVWRDFVTKVDVGSELDVRLNDGQRFRATLIGVRDDAVLLQPKTRVAVGVQPVPYDTIVAIERREKGAGIGAAKAAGIGVAAGAGTFFAILLILMSALD